MKKYDVVIVGAGPAGMFAAYELSNKNLKIAVIDKGKRVGGSGALTDGKLVLSTKSGMELEELKISEEYANEKIEIIDKIFLKHGADPELSGIADEKIKELMEKAACYNLELIPTKMRHMGSDMSYKVIKNFQEEIESKGIEFILNTDVISVEKDEFFCLETTAGKFTADKLLIAPGRVGADWFKKQATKLGVEHSPGSIDIGVRVETLSLITQNITDVIYNPRFLYITHCHGDMVRTFCTNPNGFVKREPKDKRLVNGDALKKRKSENTNFAVLVTMKFIEPLGDSSEYGKNVITFTNILGGGKPIVQRWGDLNGGSRSKIETFMDKNRDYCRVNPTLKVPKDATPADISLACPGRIMDNIKEFIKALNNIMPGLDHPSTLLYSPEVKFYATKYRTSKNLETNVNDLYVAGDGVGKSRSIVGAALTGILAAEGILEKYGGK